LAWELSRISGFACCASESVAALVPIDAMLDTWTTQSANGNTVTFKIKGPKEAGFEYSAEAVGRKIVKVRNWGKVLTRAEVEKLFAEYVAKS
jgi:hypothetical protein